MASELQESGKITLDAGFKTGIDSIDNKENRPILNPGYEVHGWKENLVTNANGLDISNYREANVFRIVIQQDSKQVGLSSEIYKAYTDDKYTHSAKVQFGSANKFILDLVNTFAASESNKLWQGAASKTGLGEWSGLFDAPINPFLTGVSGFTKTVKTFLPMTEEGFEESILRPIQRLYSVAMPYESPQSMVNKVINKLNEWIPKKQDWVEEGHKPAEGTAFKDMTLGQKFFMGASGIAGGIHSMIAGLKVLDNPIQSAMDTYLNCYIGPMLYQQILIESIDVAFGKFLYTDNDGNLYPTHAEVTIGIKSRYNSRSDTNLFSRDEHENILNKFKN